MTAVMLELLRGRSDRYHCIRLAAMVPGRGRSRPAAMLQANFRVRFVFVSGGRERSSSVIFVLNSLCYDSRFSAPLIIRGTVWNKFVPLAHLVFIK